MVTSARNVVTYAILCNITEHYTTLCNITHYATLCNITQHYATLHNITQYYITRPDSIIAMRRIWLQVPTQIRSQSSFVAPCNHFREWKDYQESSLSVVTTMNLDHPIINVIVMWLFTTCMYHVLSTTIMCGYSAIWLVLSVHEYMELPSLCLPYPKR